MKNFAMLGRDVLVAPGWGMTLVRGVLLILVGVMLLVDSAVALAALSAVIGLICVVTGVTTFVKALNASQYRELLIFYSLVIFAIGLVVMTAPMVANIVIMFTFAFWLLVGGILQLANALRSLKAGTQRNFALISGGLSLIVGVLLLLNPLAGVEMVARLLGAFLLLYGVFLCLFSSLLYRLTAR